jgi:hypothetical protein
MSTPRSLPLHRRPSRWLAALLVFALLGAQALGQAHRLAHPRLAAAQSQDVHGHGHGHAHAHAHALNRAQSLALDSTPAGTSETAHGEAAAAHGPAQPVWNALFGHEEHAGECRLFDQHSLGELAFVALLPALAPAKAEHLRAPAPTSPGQAGWLAYRARGPPMPRA